MPEATMIEFDEPLLLALEEQRRSASARAKQERYLALLHAQPGQRVLDLGCGGGGLCRALVPLIAPDGHVIGADASPDAVDLATRLSGGVAVGVLTYVCADGHSLPFADGSFDAALCISVLAFCADPGRVLAELRRVLRPGGCLVLASSDEDTRLYNGHDRALGRRILRAMADRTLDPWAGRRLASLVQSGGFRLLQEDVLVDVERHFSPGTSGYALAHMCRDYLLTQGGIPAEDYARWLAELCACERESSYCYSVTTYAYLAER
jgi:ubiquinone/menaquinone biosynthesis C-methylase UbiE